MTGCQWRMAGLMIPVALLVSACGTPREKTAPCKRPVNPASYLDAGDPCGPMFDINGDRAQALAAIRQLAGSGQE